MARSAGRILLADDDVDALDITAYALRREGYTVVTAVDGRQALQRWEHEPSDLVILDVRMPKVNGFDVCHRIRATSAVPVIMLTARAEDEDVVRGLDLGADDYIVKPYSHRQLLARVRAALRRSGVEPAKSASHLTAGDMVLVLDAHEVVRDGQHIRLTPSEFRVLQCLLANAGHVVSNDKLIEFVWGYKDGGDSNLLKTHISHVRRKVGLPPGSPGYIRNVPGTGYSIF